jgi:hypothetical protein
MSTTTTPRVPRHRAPVIPLHARPDLYARPDPRPRWYESTALRLAALASIGIVGAFGAYVWRSILGWLA